MSLEDKIVVLAETIGTDVRELINGKVDKELGKGLSDTSYTQAEKDKLNSVADEATKNLPDATLLARENHTGTQAINTVAGLQAALDAAAESGGISAEDLARLVAVEDTLPHKADLEGGKLALSQMPDIAAGRKITVDDEAARLALDVWPDLTIAYQTDGGNAYALDANDDPSVLANWSMLGSGIAGGVGSFNSRTGNVLPQSGDYTAAQITESATKQFVTADQKAEWTAKETVVGAQTKATAAGQDAKEYADLTFIEKTQKGAADGVATLDATGKLPATQLKLKTINGEVIAGEGDLAIEVDPIPMSQTTGTSTTTVMSQKAVTDALASKASTSTQVIAGTGLSGGGTLAANRTLNVSYGTTAGTAAQGNDSRLSDAREWSEATVTKAEAEATSGETRRAWTVTRVLEATQAWWNRSTMKTKLDGIQAGAQVNSVTSVAGKTGAVSLVKSDVGLSNVDNVKQAPITRTLTTGDGLSGGGSLEANRTFAVDSTVVRTTGNQTITGTKTFNGVINGTAVSTNATANKLAVRDANSTFKVGVPTDPEHPVRKQELDDLIESIDMVAEVTWNMETGSYSGTHKSVSVHESLRRCVVKVVDGTPEVQYYLDSNNSSKKEDGTPSVLTGEDGDVMVEILPFYYSITNVGPNQTYKVSRRPALGLSLHPLFEDGDVEAYYYGAFPGVAQLDSGVIIDGLNLDNGLSRVNLATTKMRSVASNYVMVGLTRDESRKLCNNNGGDLIEFWAWQAMQLLYITKYGNWDSQLMIGPGNSTGSYLPSSSDQSDSPHTLNGGSVLWGNNDASSGKYVSLFGVEQFWGNSWQWMDGLNVNNRQCYVTSDESKFADDVMLGYVSLGSPLPEASGSPIQTWQALNNALIAATVGGSTATGVGDSIWTNEGWRFATVGGLANRGAAGGVAALHVNTAASRRTRSLGARSSFKRRKQ